MLVITLPHDARKDHVLMVKDWLDTEGITHVDTANTVKIFGMPEDQKQWLDFFTVKLIPGCVVHEESPVVTPRETEELVCPPVAEMTWYQFRAITRGKTGIAPGAADVLDSVISFEIQGEGREAVYLWVMRKVTYTETKARYRAKATVLKLGRIMWDQAAGRWTMDAVEAPEEPASDLVKFGGIKDPAEYWARRALEAEQIAWTHQSAMVVGALIRQRLERKIGPESRGE